MHVHGRPRIGAAAGVRSLAAGLGALLAALCAGCASDVCPVPSNARAIDLGAFVTPPELAPEVVAVPSEFTEPPVLLSETETQDLADGEHFTRTVNAEAAADPATSAPKAQVTSRTAAQQDLRVGQRWPIESLVGQINGRPIYADEFFRVLEDRILILAASPNQQQARLALRQLVTERFNELINSELIIAEAESRLSPEMQQGVFAWLRDLQERTIAQSGGSRAGTEDMLREQEGMSVEQFIEQRKNAALAEDLLRRKVDPRVIVSWRDVERLYEFNRERFAPEPVYKLGRIRLAKDVQADKIELARSMFAEGKSFSEVAAAVGVANGGAWRDAKAGPDGMQIGDLTGDLQDALRPLKPGEHAGPIDQRAHTVWVGVIGEDRPEQVSIYDPKVQLSLRNQLQGYRRGEEQSRYIRSLRSRWLSKDIQKMEFRLLTIALTRYFDPTRN